MSNKIGNRDYSKAKIYKIVDNTSDNIYIGSTLKPLSKRLVQHRQDYSKYLKGKKPYYTAFEVLKNQNYIIILIDDYIECQNIEQLRAKERHYIESLKCVNKNLPGQSPKEGKHKYYENNKEKLLQKQREYCELNKEILSQKSKEYREKNKEILSQKKKEYSEKNKEILSQKKKEYREKNKDIIKEKQRYICSCSCGHQFTRSNKSQHMKSKKHIQYMEQQNIQQNDNI